MVEDLKEFRAKKNGQVTPKSLSEGLSDWSETGELETLIIVTKTKDGEVNTFYSHSVNTELIGLLEVAKLTIIDETF